MRKKVLVISRCSDCSIVTCELREPCGGIPEGCWLEDAEEKSEEVMKRGSEGVTSKKEGDTE